jgi:hypothetical protein
VQLVKRTISIISKVVKIIITNTKMMIHHPRNSKMTLTLMDLNKVIQSLINSKVLLVDAQCHQNRIIKTQLIIGDIKEI